MDLSAPIYDNLTAPVEFRFYTFSPNNNSSVEYDNFELNGTVALASVVPEPGSLGLASLMLLGLIGKRRRQR